MTLPSGADIKIGSYEFFLDNSVEEPYSHVLESLYSDTQKIPGSDATTANPNVLQWFYDDWAGGGEVKFYSEQVPDSYWYGNANPRIRGSMQSPPDTGTATATLTDSSPTRWFTVAVGGKAWFGAGRDLFYTTDGTTLSQWNGTALFGAGFVIDGMTHDGSRPWVTASNGVTRSVKRINSTTTQETAVTDRGTTEGCFGMAMLEGLIYLWTGAKLYSYDSTVTLPIAHTDDEHMVHNPFGEGGTYGGIAASESSIFYFTASAGVTEIFEYRFSSATQTFLPRPVWKPSPGFTGKFIGTNMGVLYIYGDYTDQAALFGMSQVNREPLFLSYVGQAFVGNGVTATPSALYPSYGAQMLLGLRVGSTNYYFIYDAEIDSLSQLDEQTTTVDGSNYAMVTLGNRRMAIGNNADTTARLRRWLMDFDTPTRSWQWVSSAWNQGYPMDEKLLFGFEVVQDPTIAAGTLQVYYMIDESGTWVSAGTTAAGVKYTKFNLGSSNVKYRNLRMRVDGSAGARMLSITARSYINSYQELFRLVIKMRDESPNNRPSTRQAKAEKLREYLNTLAAEKNIVTFLNGRKSPRKGVYSTHLVVVEFPRYGGIRIRRGPGKTYEGGAEVQLRVVS